MFDPISIALTIMTTAASMMQARQAQRQQQKIQRAQLDAASQEKWAAYEQREKDRQAQLKKSLAKRRAQMASGGISSASGSAAALMQGIQSQSYDQTQQDYLQTERGISNAYDSMSANLLAQSDRNQQANIREIGSLTGTLAPMFEGTSDLLAPAKTQAAGSNKLDIATI